MLVQQCNITSSTALVCVCTLGFFVIVISAKSTCGIQIHMTNGKCINKYDTHILVSPDQVLISPLYTTETLSTHDSPPSGPDILICAHRIKVILSL